MHALLFLLALATPFDYDATQPLNVQLSTSETRRGVLVQELTYASPKGGRVPATLVTPSGGAPIREPALLFMHWGLGNRRAFLDEALTAAHAGVTSMLIDAPWNRPDAKEQSESDQLIQTVIDLRRAVDFLQERNVVRHRIGYVGLSFGAWTGAILSAIEPRIEAFVLAGGLASNSTATNDKDIEHLDAEKWVGKAKAPMLLQFALKDEYITREQATRYDKAAPPHHMTKWYEGGHEFNAAARRDRLSWLGTIFGFALPDETYKPIAPPDRPVPPAFAEIAKFGVVIDIPGMQYARVRRDVVWKDGLRMDVYYPPAPLAANERIPAIISLSGQAPPEFMQHIRSMRFATTFAQAVAARTNRIVVVPDLRSVRATNLQTVASDVDDLIAYVRAHAGELQIDGDSLALVFRSAGWSYGFRSAMRGAPPYIKAVVAHYVALSADEFRDTVTPELLREIDPPIVIQQGKAPVLLVTAQHDFFYNPAQTKRFLDAASAAGVNVKHIHLPNSGHAFDIDSDLEESRDALLQTMLFLRDRLPVRR